MTQTAVIYANKRQRAKLTQQGIPFVEVYDEYVLSDVTPAQVADLRAQGYEIELQEQPPVVQVRGRSVAMISAEEDARAAGPIRLRDLQVVRPGPPPDAFGPGPHYYLVQFIGPIKDEWLAEIQTHGGSVHDSMPPYAYVVGLDQPAYEWITTAPAYVRFVGHFTPELRLDPSVQAAFPRLPMVGRAQLHDLAPAERSAATSTAERVSNTFVVRFFDAEDLAQGVPLLQALGATVGSYEPGATILSVSFAPDTPDIAARLEQISRIHGVKLVEGQKLRQLYNNVAIGLMGGQGLSSPTWLGLSGRGEVVAVADSGLDTGNPDTIHPDFAGRVVGPPQLARIVRLGRRGHQCGRRRRPGRCALRSWHPCRRVGVREWRRVSRSRARSPFAAWPPKRSWSSRLSSKHCCGPTRTGRNTTADTADFRPPMGWQGCRLISNPFLNNHTTPARASTMTVGAAVISASTTATPRRWIGSCGSTKTS